MAIRRLKYRMESFRIAGGLFKIVGIDRDRLDMADLIHLVLFNLRKVIKIILDPASVRRQSELHAEVFIFLGLILVSMVRQPEAFTPAGHIVISSEQCHRLILCRFERNVKRSQALRTRIIDHF